MSRFNTLTNSLVKLISSCFVMDEGARVHLSFNGKEKGPKGRPTLKAEISTTEPVSAILSHTVIKETVEMWAHAVEVEYSNNNSLYVDILIEGGKVVKNIVKEGVEEGDDPLWVEAYIREIMGRNHYN